MLLKIFEFLLEKKGSRYTIAGIRNMGMVAMNFMIAPTKPVGINNAI